MSLEKIKEILFSDNIALIGFLTNLGLVTITFVVSLMIKNLISTELTNLWKVNIFAITYLILYALAYKEALIENVKFKAGFVLSGIIVAVLVIKEYILLLI